MGKRWSTRFSVVTVKGPGVVEMEVRCAARERITVPAGTFNAFRLEGQGFSIGGWGSSQLSLIRWIDPGRVKRPVASVDRRTSQSGRIVAAEREELVAYRES